MSRKLVIVGQTPDGDVPSLFAAPYKGIPQFNLKELDHSMPGPDAHKAGKLLAPASSSFLTTQLPVGVNRYSPGPSDSVTPFSKASGAPVDFVIESKTPLAPARFPRPDPSR